MTMLNDGAATFVTLALKMENNKHDKRASRTKNLLDFSTRLKR